MAGLPRGILLTIRCYRDCWLFLGWSDGGGKRGLRSIYHHIPNVVQQSLSTVRELCKLEQIWVLVNEICVQISSTELRVLQDIQQELGVGLKYKGTHLLYTHHVSDHLLFRASRGGATNSLSYVLWVPT